ncbi:MAG: 5-(carboxyamino)imidazole ribonucleotide mutase [Candidatus Omnitrophica bacterium]|nr:5-(carboxyamino)imidazole ribonucleotide mutase [Candidatus Omnitrophota bacterium]
MKKPLVGIIMGSQSDLNLMNNAAVVLEEFGIPYEVTVISAHRAPKMTFDYAAQASGRGLKVIIAGAGGAAHLPGVIAAVTTLPVIGVPVKSSNSIGGLDSLLSIVQMPDGVPVATVAVNGAKNAGILAAQIIATFDKKVASHIKNHKDNLKNKVQGLAKKMARQGHKAFLNLA